MRTEVEREVVGDGSRWDALWEAGRIEKSQGPLTIRKHRCSHSYLGDRIKKDNEEQALVARQ